MRLDIGLSRMNCKIFSMGGNTGTLPSFRAVCDADTCCESQLTHRVQKRALVGTHPKPPFDASQGTDSIYPERQIGSAIWPLTAQVGLASLPFGIKWAALQMPVLWALLITLRSRPPNCMVQTVRALSHVW